MYKHFILMLIVSAHFAACNKVPHYASYDEYPVYEGQDLELTYSAHASQFKVWSPTATEVKLLLYDNGFEGAAYQTHSLKRANNGTWTIELEGDLKNKFYTFQAKIGEKWHNETPGMWVKATGVNGKRAAIIDMNETNPDGWELHQRPALNNFTDIIIYELHMRDFSVSPNSGIKNKGKYLAFTEHGTINTAGEPTGIDHLKALGITHVHLLPVFDFASIDETALDQNKYNWGYDPLNFNVPEGSYSTDPYNPITRIKEFKQMVQSLHKNGLRVIMDVVYNHTFDAETSHLNQLVPGYFYRTKSDSTWSNASGCGNETASERAMMRKFIIESVVYWATEYKIDGFRFDLMGIHDIETMNAVRAALDKVDPTIYVYGEGWTADTSPLPEDKRAIKRNAKQLDNIGVFSDDLRDALKGSWTNKELPGFASGIDSLEMSVMFGITAAAFHPQVDYTLPIYSKEPYTNNPTQIINYVSCHDDMCLVDKLALSKPKDATADELKRFNLLAQTVVFTSMGVPFMYAGEELYRNKKGINNTYISPDSINQINWDNKTLHTDVHQYYSGIIALRNQHPAFRIATQELMAKHLTFLSPATPNVIAYMLTNNANGDAWRNILVIHNGNRKAATISIPQGAWITVVHDTKVNLNGLQTIKDTTFTVAASSSSIMFEK